MKFIFLFFLIPLIGSPFILLQTFGSSLTPSRSTEWKNLPHQSWEQFNILLPPEVDPLGFDRRNKLNIPRASGYDPGVIPGTEKLRILGYIIGSRSESKYLIYTDTVYIESEDVLQINRTYAITEQPHLLKSKKSDRSGYSYIISGKVKILAIKDKLYIGTITSARGSIARGSLIISAPEKIPEFTPIAGPKPIQGTLILDHAISTYTTAQYKEVFVDRGTEDGVQAGMIFRAYQHYDLSNNKKLTSSDFIIDADILVTQVTLHFCSGIIIKNINTVEDHSSVILLTDISDLTFKNGFTEKDLKNHSLEIDPLDQLDDKKKLGNAEKAELKQLEHWGKAPSLNLAPLPIIPSPHSMASPSGMASPELTPLPNTIPSLNSTPSPYPSALETNPPPLLFDEIPEQLPPPAPEEHPSSSPTPSSS